MIFSNYFSKQARKPSGIFGRFYMSRLFEKGNAELNTHLYNTLSLKPDDHVLEIGFGTGTLIEKIAENIDGGLIEGIDFSKSMVAIARNKNQKHIKSGKVKIHLGNFDNFHLNDNSFNKVFSVNTTYFWEKPKSVISKMYRILKPGGKLIIGFHEKSEMEKMPLKRDVFQYYSTNELADLLSTDGSLNRVDIISKKGKSMSCHCAVATK